MKFPTAIMTDSKWNLVNEIESVQDFGDESQL